MAAFKCRWPAEWTVLFFQAFFIFPTREDSQVDEHFWSLKIILAPVERYCTYIFDHICIYVYIPYIYSVYIEKIYKHPNPLKMKHGPSHAVWCHPKRPATQPVERWVVLRCIWCGHHSAVPCFKDWGMCSWNANFSWGTFMDGILMISLTHWPK